MPYVMLRPNWPGAFHRTVERDKQGKPVRTLEFSARVPVMVEDADMEILNDGDMGKALVFAAVDSDGNPLPKPAARHSEEVADETEHFRRRTKRKPKE